MRTKLFLSYSKGDVEWRDWFLKHLRTMVSIEDGLWVDCESIRAGSDWNTQLVRALGESKCALVLLTPKYLEIGRFANDHELPMLLAEQLRGLTLLPVLVEPCSFEKQHPGLGKVQFVTWRNDTQAVRDGDQSREVLRALKEEGDDAETPAARQSAIDRAVMKVCEHVRKAFGIVGQITEVQRDDLFEQTKNALDAVVNEATTTALEAERVALDKEPIHSGEFAVVYRGTFEGEPVAVKALPTASWLNRIGKAFESARRTSVLLRDASFIRVNRIISKPDVHAIVMEYIDWPTLDEVRARYPGKRLPPQIVAKILTPIAGAQDDAHKRDVQIGALSPASIHVDPDWEVRLTPIRIEAHLARSLTLSTGQLVNWDILTMLTPEIYAGHQPITREDLDAHEQYYLGLLGLELLNGRRPVEVSCFQDLDLKSKFFDDPRAFFESAPDGANRWTDDSPALAYLLTRMLSRVPADRLPSARVVKDELRRVAEDKLPDSLRRSLEAELGQVICEDFASRFYCRLFQARPSLELRFRDRAIQSRMLAGAIRDLVAFRRDDVASRFFDHVNKHRNLGIGADDVEAFRLAFVAEVISTSERSGHRSGLACGDAWNAVLKLGLGVMAQDLRLLGEAADVG